jgi:hypothetical protein
MEVTVEVLRVKLFGLQIGNNKLKKAHLIYYPKTKGSMLFCEDSCTILGNRCCKITSLIFIPLYYTELPYGEIHRQQKICNIQKKKSLE